MPCLFLKFWPNVCYFLKYHLCETKCWVYKACHSSDRDGQTFTAVGCWSRMFISSKRFWPRVAQAQWSCQQTGKLYSGKEKKLFMASVSFMPQRATPLSTDIWWKKAFQHRNWVKHNFSKYISMDIFMTFKKKFYKVSEISISFT